jgi:hypothetical protein
MSGVQDSEKGFFKRRLAAVRFGIQKDGFQISRRAEFQLRRDLSFGLVHLYGPLNHQNLTDSTLPHPPGAFSFGPGFLLALRSA